MQRKPSSWENLDDDFDPILPEYPRVTAKEVWGTHDVPKHPLIDFTGQFKTFGPRGYFILVRPNGNEYLVRTESFRYMRYAMRIK